MIVDKILLLEAVLSEAQVSTVNSKPHTPNPMP
jgi:hypothetical protein